MKTSLLALTIGNLLLLTCVHHASAANSTFYSDLASFSAAAGGPLQTQDFSGYAQGSNLRNVEFLPGISVDSNMNSVEAFSATDRVLFGIDGRASGNARYDVNLALPYRAVSFEIAAFEAVPGNLSTAVDAGLLSVFFADSTSQSLPVNGNATGASIFFGVVSDTLISSVRWAEAHEGSGGNEETALDNFRVRPVPEPTSGILCCSMMLTTLLAGRRRRAV